MSEDAGPDAVGTADVGSRFVVEVAGVSFTCGRDESVLRAMIAAGKAPVPVGCRSGGCGVCRVRIVSGSYRAGPMSRAKVSEADERAGLALACRIFPCEDLRLEPHPWRPGASRALAA